MDQMNTGDRLLADDRVLVSRGIEQNCTEFRLLYRHLPHARIFKERKIIWIDSGIDYAHWNAVVFADLGLEEDRDQVGEVIKYFEERKRPLGWWIGPSSQPSDLGDRLEGHGFRHCEQSPGMALDLHKLVRSWSGNSALEIITVDSDERLDQFVSLFQESFHQPVFSRPYLRTVLKSVLSPAGDPGRLQLFLGLLDQQPVGVSALYPAAGVAGIHMVGTLAEFRGQGIGTLMTAHCLEQARRLGYRWAVLRASASGERVYRVMGFESFFLFHFYELKNNDLPRWYRSIGRFIKSLFNKLTSDSIWFC